MTYTVERVQDLDALDISHLVEESQKEGYRFLGRLVDDYEDGTNMFTKPGEALLIVCNGEGRIIAIGGVNQSPFSKDTKEARLRRFYVLESERRKGVGSILLGELLNCCKEVFTTITVRTESSKADAFYRANGFAVDETVSETTHVFKL